VQAFSRLAEAHPDAVLYFVGDRNDQYSAALHDYIERADLADRVAVLPVVSDPYRWHEVADILVSASDNESLPLVILEAMAFETPVVAASVFGVPEVIDDGRTGYLCAPRDLDSLVSALDRALSAANDDRRAIGRAAGNLVRARHDHRRYVDNFRRMLQALIENREAFAGWSPDPDQTVSFNA
jgi:D-inositol-3-phosphate glycosyltransferase